MGLDPSESPAKCGPASPFAKLRTPPPISAITKLVILGAFLCAAAVTLYFGAWSDQPLPDHPLITGLNDLVFHLAAFATLTLLGLLLWPKWIPVLLVLFLGGCAIELVQMINPQRDASLADVAANLAGILLGALAYLSTIYLLGTVRLRSVQSTWNGDT